MMQVMRSSDSRSGGPVSCGAAPSPAPWRSCAFTGAAAFVSVVLGLAVMTSAAAGEGAGPIGQYKDLFGAEEAAALASPGTKDEAALAAKLLKAAESVQDDPALVAFMLEKAYDLGVKDESGLPTAVDAARRLLAKDAQTYAGYRPKLLEAHRLRYQKGPRAGRAEAGTAYIEALVEVGDAAAAEGKGADAINAYRQAVTVATALRSTRKDELQRKIKSIEARSAARKRIESMGARLRKEPDNTDLARKLAIASVSEAADLALAARYAKASRDKDLQALIGLAQLDPEELDEQEWVRLGDWYKGLAAAAAKSVRVSLIERAGSYYARFLDVHTREDAERLKVSLASQEIERELAKAAGGAAMNLLSMVDLQKDTAGRGSGWSKQARGALACGDSANTLAFPVGIAANGSYRFRLEFVRESGDSSLHIFLPVADRRFMLQLVQNEASKSAIYWIDGKSVFANPAALKQVPLENGKKYAVEAQVSLKGQGSEKGRVADIAVTLNGQPYIHWRGPVTSLSGPTDKPLAVNGKITLDTFRSKWLFPSASLGMLAGEARPERAQ